MKWIASILITAGLFVVGVALMVGIATLKAHYPGPLAEIDLAACCIASFAVIIAAVRYSCFN